MNKINPEDPAMPVVADNKYDTHLIMELQHPGLTIRAEISSRIMAAMLSNVHGVMNYSRAEVFASEALICTDALIAELNK